LSNGLWVALVVLVPLAYNPVSRWQWEPDKVALALALTGLLLSQSLRRSLHRATQTSDAPSPAVRQAGRKWWRDPATWIGLSLLVRGLTTSRSLAPHWSLWGDPAWRNGLWLTMASAALFGLARRQLTTPERRARAVRAILISSAAVAGYGVLQYTVLDMLTAEDIVRVNSTLGHPNLLAAYLAMAMPLTAARALSGPRRAWTGLLLALQGLCLVFTYSRAGWLAAMAGLAILGLAWLWLAGRRRVAGLVAGGIVAGLAVLLVLSLLPPLPGSAPHALQTLTNMFRWQGSTVQIRLLGWRASLEAIGERPWLGYGPATSRTVMAWFMPPELAPFGGSAALGGRPHNMFLEMAVESGLVGLACYLAMIGAILLPLAGALLKGVPETERPRSYEQCSILAALAANLVTYLFSLESAAPTVLFWSLAGMAHAKGNSRDPRNRLQPAKGLSQTPARLTLGWAVAAGSVALAGWMIATDALAFVGETVLASRELWHESTEVLALAGDLAPTPEVYLASLGNIYAIWAEKAPTAGEAEPLWQRGADVHARLVRRRPEIVEYWQLQGSYLRRWRLASRNGEPDAEIARQAIASFTEAIRLSPRDPDLWLDRALTWIDAGDLDKALADVEQAGALLDGYTRYYGAMSVHALARGDPEAAAAWQERALDAQRDWDAWSWRR
jgi:O-antigen ligase